MHDDIFEGKSPISPANVRRREAFLSSVKWLKIEDSYNPKKLQNTIETALEQKGFKVIIIKRECALQANRWRNSQIRKLKQEGKKAQDVIYHIHGCQLCYECARVLSCPAIRRTEIDGFPSMKIDEDRCIRCGVCYQICPNSAIHKSIINALDVEVPFREI